MILGIDTSNYKTSIAVTDRDNSVVFEKSEYLEVGMGKRGLRQSEAFFMHSNRLPNFIAETFEQIDPEHIEAIGVSTRPRRVEGSYMPCFLAGVNAAKEIAAALRIPVYGFSHQEGHAAAIIESRPGMLDVSAEGKPADTKSLLFHLSGGTSEFLICEPDDEGYSLTIAGGTRDISIGQLIDRAGVAMGCSFPAGMYLDELATKHLKAGREPESAGIAGIIPAIKLQDGWFNLSGIETRILRYIESMQDQDQSPGMHGALAHELFDRIAGLLAASAAELSQKHGIGRVYMAGGVASSSFIRGRIASYPGMPDIVFGEPSLSGDNAVGIALLASRMLMSGRKSGITDKK